MEQMPTVAGLPDLMPPFYTLQANTAHRLPTQSLFFSFTAEEKISILNNGNSVLDGVGDDVNWDGDERRGGGV